ncbi:MAG: hypothetical protein AAGI38_21330 [Bacteroidota bacterium]
MLSKPIAIRITILVLCLAKTATAQTEIDSLSEKDGWLLNYCDSPAGGNVDSVNGLIGVPKDWDGKDQNRRVIFRALIDTTGQIVKCTILKAPNPVMRQAAESQVHLVRFQLGACFKGYLREKGIDEKRIWINFVLTAKKSRE